MPEIIWLNLQTNKSLREGFKKMVEFSTNGVGWGGGWVRSADFQLRKKEKLQSLFELNCKVNIAHKMAFYDILCHMAYDIKFHKP